MIIQYIWLGTTTLPDFTNITRTLVNGDTIQVEDLTGEQLTQMYPSNWRNAQPLTPWGSGLSTYPIWKIQFSVNADWLSCGIFDGTDAVSLSNGKVWYDGNITLPPFPAIPVTPWFGLPLALWSYDDGSTIQYEWTYWPEVDVGGWFVPPINFLGNTTPWAMFIGSAICINFTGAPKTPWVDTFNNFDDWFFNRLEAIYENISINANPWYYLYTTWSGSIRNNVDFSYYTFDWGDNVPVWTQPDDTYAQGIVIPNGESMTFRIVLSQGAIFIVPNFTAIQAVDTLAFVWLVNNTGSDWTWGVNDLNDVVSGIQNVSSSSYIGEYTNLTDLANGQLVPVEWQTALVGGTLYEYLQWTWTVTWGWSGNTFTATTGDSFATDTGLVPVKLSGWQVQHIYKDYQSVSQVVARGWFTSPLSIQLDQSTEVQVAIGNALSNEQIYISIATFNTATGALIQPWNGSYPLSNVRTDLPVTGLRIDKTHFALWWVDTSNDAKIAVFEVPNNTTVINLLSSTVIQSDATAFRICKSWFGDSAIYNVPNIIAFAGFQTTSTEWFFGNIQLDYYYGLITPNITMLPWYTTQADWDNFLLAGMEANGDASCLIVLPTGAANAILINPWAGLVDTETIAVSSSFALDLKYVEDTYFCLLEARPTNDVIATMIDITGSTITVTGSTNIAFWVTGLVTDPFSCGIWAFHNWNGFTNSCLEFVVCTDDWLWATTFEIYQYSYAGGVIGSLVDNISIASDQSLTTKNISVSTYRDDEVYSARVVSLRYISNNSNAFASFQFSSNYWPTIAWLYESTRCMPQYEECVGVIEWGALITTTVTVYTVGAKAPLTWASWFYYAQADAVSIGNTPSNLRIGYGITPDDVVYITLDKPEENEFVFIGQIAQPMSLVTSYQVFWQQLVDFNMGTFPKCYTPIITITAMADNCTISIDNFDQSCMRIDPMTSNIRVRPSLFSKKWSYIKIRRSFDHCDAGWYILEDGRKKDLSVNILPSDTNMYQTPELFVPRRYTGYEIIEFWDGTPATEIIGAVQCDTDKIQLLPYNATDMQIDFTASTTPPDIGQIIWPVASTTFYAAPGDNITIKKKTTSNIVSSIWEQVDANTNI